MNCPNCGKTQPESNECLYCGIVVSKFQTRQKAQHQQHTEPAEPKKTPPPPRPFKPLIAARMKPLVTTLQSRSGPWLDTLMKFFFPPVSARSRFFTSMARMIGSGVSLEEGLETMRLTARGALRQMAAQGAAGVRLGNMLHEALSTPLPLLTTAQSGILEAGERTGNMVEALRHLASMEEERLDLMRKLLSSLAYPAVVLIASCFMLPLPTLVLGSSSDYFWEVASRLGVLLSGAVTILIIYRLSTLFLGHLLSYLPGPVERTLFPSRRALFFLVLRTCLESGLPIREALHLATGTWRSKDNKETIAQAIRSIDTGSSLTKALAPLLDTNLVVLLATGEKSGKLDESFAELYEVYSTRAAGRRRLMLIIVSVLMTVALLAYAASEIMTGYQRTVEAPMQELEEMMGRELRGIMNSM
jgi:type II secretory pathway component PulF